MPSRKAFIAGSSVALLSLIGLDKFSFGLTLYKTDKAMQTPQNSSSNDFDFYLGKWKIRNRKLKSRLTGSNEWEEFESTDHVIKILNGAGNFGQYRAMLENKPFAGITLRLFDPVTNLWSLYWADSIHGKLDTPVVGHFENKIGIFYCKDTLRGQPVDVKFHWDATDSEQPVWSQAFSADGGKTWEWNWYMYNERVADK